MMRDSVPVFTRQRAGMDTRVWLTLLLLLILSAGLFGFLWVKPQKCIAFNIKTDGPAGSPNILFVGNKVVFSVNAADKEQADWDFGDQTKREKGITVAHTYSREGWFIVQATINGRCTEMLTIKIRQVPAAIPPALPETAIIAQNPIQAPEYVQAGHEVSVNSSEKAQSYEWMVLNSNEYPPQKTAKATYTFRSKGRRNIQLRLDNDPAKVYKWTITVLPAEGSMPPEANK